MQFNGQKISGVSEHVSFNLRFFFLLKMQKYAFLKKNGLIRRLSLIGIDAIWQVSLGCLLMRTIASFLRNTVT